MSRPNPEAALEQYSNDLKRRGVPTKQLTLAKHFLRHLLTTLRDLPQDGNGYRAASETTLRNFPDEANFLDLVREFFPYWSGEHGPRPTTQPTVATVSPPAEQAGDAPKSSPSVSARSYGAAMAQMESDPWSHCTVTELERHLHQLRSLARYGEALKKASIDEPNIHARMGLIKLLLFTIRDMPQNTDSYRSGVDKVLLLFPQQERWHVFVSLAREFFYFLAGDADASSRLQTQLSHAELLGLIAGQDRS